jgi:hypothetical protein
MSNRHVTMPAEERARELTLTPNSSFHADPTTESFGTGSKNISFTSRYRALSVQDHSPLPDDPGRFGNAYMRFTILFAFLVLAIGTLPLWLSFAIPTTIAYVNGAVMLFFSATWLVIALCAVNNYRKLDRITIPKWHEAVALRGRRFRHIVVVPCYLDPLEILHTCVDTLAMQSRARELVVVITFEKKSPELEAKVRSVEKAYKSSGTFGDFLVVIHEVQKATEIPGGCSNKNFALREAYKYCSKHHGDAFSKSRYTITTCDTDSKFHPRHFEVLEEAYNAENPSDDVPVKMNVWQPPLFYNWALDERPFFNRVTCLMRTMMMLGGLISFNLNPMSIFSYPMELALAAGFINPRYSVDDIIAKVRWMCDTNSTVPVKLLPIIAISGPTIGTSFTEEVFEWGRQIRRWIVGASESFHYFVIHWRGRPFLAGIGWFFMFFMYYAVLLCCAGVFNVLASIPFPWVDYPVVDLGPFGNFDTRYFGLVALVLQMLAFAMAFGIDAAGARRLGLNEKVNPLRNVLHWLSSPFVLIVYGFIAFLSIIRFVCEGKKMAGHDMAAKDGFAQVRAAANTDEQSLLLTPGAAINVPA